MELELWGYTKKKIHYLLNRLLPRIYYFFILNENDDLFLLLKNVTDLKLSLTFFKYNSLLKFNYLFDIIAIDFYYNRLRFKMVYGLLSLTNLNRVFVGIFLKDTTTILADSVTRFFKSAGWSEREVWDMFGIFFLNHPSLKRILTDYGFRGHPLRKDFPLSGYLEIYYNDVLNEILYRPVTLNQGYRFYNFNSNWHF